KKVSDHHAVIPTIVAGEADLSALPAGEREVLKLVCRQVLMAVSEAHCYMEASVVMDCGGTFFTAKGRTVTKPGWKTYIDKEQRDKSLPNLAENSVLTPDEVSIKEGQTTPPKHYTEDTLLSA
ncbi:MAG TPA: DNA topoisomerase III, partial [Clostridiales bacterium]|nr:DNA topoisomerase III [Clostridiales bacterium]